MNACLGNFWMAALQAEVNRTTVVQGMTILTLGVMAGMFMLRFE